MGLLGPFLWIGIDAESVACVKPDVKGMVQVALKSPQVPVGTADTWTSWVNPVNAVRLFPLTLPQLADWGH